MAQGARDEGKLGLADLLTESGRRAALVETPSPQQCHKTQAGQMPHVRARRQNKSLTPLLTDVPARTNV